MRAILSILFSFFFLSALAQEITILNKNNRAPVVGVAVFNQTKSVSAISDLDGKVSLNRFKNDDQVTFQHISFEKVTIKKSKISNYVLLSPNTQDLSEIVISASKFQQNKREVPQKIVSLNAEQINFSTPQTSADLLQSSGQVFVQKSQLGGGSPMIRGFSTNRLLLSVDGIRMNTAIFRGGNVQNVISIDPFSVQKTEVILGAGSVIYGSDAIGGVMNFYTKKPSHSKTDKMEFDANILARYSSANKEKTSHVDLNFGHKKWAYLTSFSFSDFEDLKMGKYGSEDYLRLEYVQTSNGIDEVVANSDTRIQKNTGYNQVSFMQKALYKHDDKTTLDIGLHYSSTSDYPRYDRLIRYSNGQLRSAEWYYGPQKWFMGNVQLTRLSSSSSIHDKVKFSLAYQNFKESRIDRNFNSENRRIRKENVDAISGNVDFEKSLSDYSMVFYGAEYIFNRIGSKAKQENIFDNSTEPIAIRYPDGSTWQSMAAYLSYKYKPNATFTFQSGVRYNHILINADVDENNMYYNLPFNDTDINTGAVTGTAGISWIPNKTIQWKLNASTAFRAPNIDDVGKVFDSEPGSVVVPNANLKPEYAYGGELGAALNFNDFLILDLSTYYTYLDNALVRRDYQINGESEILYDGETSNVQATQNASKAWIYGFEAGLKLKFSDNLKLLSQYSIVGGTEEDENGVEVPVRHVAPAFGNTHLVWGKDKLKFDAFVNYNGELSNNQLAPSLADYLFATDKNGNPYAPSWYTLNFRSQYRYNNTTVTATVENITNQRYRTYSSGIAAAGLNFILSVNYNL
ncbi:MAG: TonB-dependent receptor [Bacteroidia bacterium]|nr:TonB-dependent receptor [Bacteroidia bacterium]